MTENMFYFVVLILLAAACFYSGYEAGVASVEARYGKYYREICARLIEAIKRLSE